jgi:hypothetical protein
MSSNDVRLDLDIDGEVVELLVEYGYLAELGAELHAEEVRDVIDVSDIPAAAGEPPHSRGPYRDSWKSGKAKRKGLGVTAWSFSMAKAVNGESLADILDTGRGPIEPHPHVNAAIDRAERRLQAEIDAVNARLRMGA